MPRIMRPRGDVVEQRDLLGDAQRVVPRQHDDTGAEQDVRVLAGHVRQPLHRVGAHRVVVEVVLDRPQRLEAELDGEVAQAQLVLVHRVVAERVVRVLEGGVVTDVHAFIPPWSDARHRTRGRRGDGPSHGGDRHVTAA